MNKILILGFVAIMLISLVSAHGEETFAEAEEIIMQKISCDELTLDQLEILGDYYMEQMHPGEAHAIMDEMMGGEGSGNLRQIHINMGKAFYCGEHESMSGGMMDMMMNRGEIMNYPSVYSSESVYGLNIIMWLLAILILIVLILVIIFLLKKMQNGKKRR